jgi:DNA-binding MarR family transcriptional regulator
MPTTTTLPIEPTDFAQLAQEAHVSVLRTAEVLARAVSEALRPYGITPTQYNVLRILRGGPPQGLPCSDIGGRMITHEPDVTRMLDRLQKLGLAERERDQADRRVVLTRITAVGRALLARLDAPILALHERQLGHLDADTLREVVRLLAAMREGAAAACR